MSTNETPPTTTDHLQAIHALCDDMVGRMVGYRTTEATVPELEQIKQHAEALQAKVERLDCAFCDTLNAYDIPYDPENFCIEEGDIDVRRLKRDVYGGDLPGDDSHQP